MDQATILRVLSSFFVLSAINLQLAQRLAPGGMQTWLIRLSWTGGAVCLLAIVFEVLYVLVV